ncbi:RNA polymerase, sigma subunit, ECF family [Filimonas lacunae]|uniref:RNA polymerase, sigma subunit, ECF family n=1 Tax=Filimonas lacunae TaxID=477680 RepID=A0A173MHR2_9BACT|nr:RNA polymerase sigma-70 factor [Filimonas lacunae]BAV06958.1 RNA polymerase ECF-type sigma factor [Filimonas lacunae]SIS97236.1 RNA polymerase, sigma subunit, ECF family [Filimonas lacunae]
MRDLQHLSDEELVHFLNEGNEWAFSEIYNRYWMKLLAQATYDLQNEAEAEECVQDVFVKIWKNRASLTLRYQLSTYLYRAIKNQAINVLEARYAKRNQLLPLPAHVPGGAAPSADAALLEKELMAALEAAIAALPEKCAVVYRMSRLEGKNNQQIASELGIAEKTVEGHITKAIKGIREGLDGPAFACFFVCFELSHHTHLLH